MAAAYVREVKLCLVGDSGVGKSSIVHRLVNDAFQTNLENTIGAAFFTKSINLDSTTYKYQIWDTAGQEKYRALTPMYFRGASAAVVVYDITRRDSFNSVRVWIKELKNYSDMGIVIAIAGNKCDLDAEREIQFKEALEFASSQNAIFVETSAKTSINVTTLFLEISECLASQRNPERPSQWKNDNPLTDDIIIPKANGSNKKSCCSIL